MIELPVTAYNDKLITVLKRAEKEGKDSVVYHVEASFASNIPWRQHFNINVDKLLPLIYIPEVKMDTIGYDSLNAEGVTLMLHANISNKNRFPIKFKNLKFKFALADNPWVEGKKPGIVDIKDTSITSLILPLRISFKQIGKSLGPLIVHGKNTGFKFVATMQLVSDNEALQDSKVIIKDEGVLKEMTKLAKEEKQKAKEKKKEEKARGIEPKKKEKHHLKIKKEKNIKK
jgi:LEA14-like dessication related protein